ncbi:MAG: transporter [Deltaproteobacteria bacterium]|nr:transporter [Deltaproteobacteria bacterium]
MKTKSEYHLFKPVPKEEMRDMKLDRPDTIETPCTVDAGHFQVEMSLFSYTYDAQTPEGGTVAHNFSVAPMLLKAGVLNWMDLELGLEPYVRNRQTDISTSTVTSAKGFGNITARLKANFFGNDEGRLAFGTIPFMVAPTNSVGKGGDRYEGGIMFPVEFALSEKWGIAAQTQYNVVENAAANGHEWEFINIAAVSRSMTDALTVFTEFYSQVSRENGVPWVGRIDVGGTYFLSPNVALDAAMNIGITKAADDLNPFAGISARY